jgi:hypothetical protein
MPQAEIRCHVCGGILGPIDIMLFDETCSEECFDAYYTNPDEEPDA